jgi:hypothetical protein
MEVWIIKERYEAPLEKLREVQAYLGENVVNEKEYLSAIVSVDPGICSWKIPKIERCGWRSRRFADVRKVERLSCCRCWILKFKLQAAPAASRSSCLTTEAQISEGQFLDRITGGNSLSF